MFVYFISTTESMKLFVKPLDHPLEFSSQSEWTYKGYMHILYKVKVKEDGGEFFICLLLLWDCKHRHWVDDLVLTNHTKGLRNL